MERIWACLFVKALITRCFTYTRLARFPLLPSASPFIPIAMRILLCLFGFLAATHALLEFTDSFLYDMNDIKGTPNLPINLCDVGCRVYLTYLDDEQHLGDQDNGPITIQNGDANITFMELNKLTLPSEEKGYFDIPEGTEEFIVHNPHNNFVARPLALWIPISTLSPSMKLRMERISRLRTGFMGTAFAPVKSDIAGNVRTRWLKDPIGQDTLQKLIASDLKDNGGKLGIATEGLLWLKRGQEFMLLMLIFMVRDYRKDKASTESLVSVINGAYEGSLKRHHGFISKQVFKKGRIDERCAIHRQCQDYSLTVKPSPFDMLENPECEYIMKTDNTITKSINQAFSSPIISLLYDSKSEMTLDITFDFPVERSIDASGYLSSPGYIGCYNKTFFFRSESYNYGVSSINETFLVDGEIQRHVSFYGDINTDEAGPVLLYDMDTEAEPLIITGLQIDNTSTWEYEMDTSSFSLHWDDTHWRGNGSFMIRYEVDGTSDGPLVTTVTTPKTMPTVPTVLTVTTEPTVTAGETTVVVDSTMSSTTVITPTTSASGLRSLSFVVFSIVIALFL
ncbi:hypothetical protein PRIPAC_84312 [Pristionchus pacificus]|uniref:GLTP domain-containing protein n=1 Tax=Pristionchus pacificus TaxID=54126 RepID=A0A2A6BUF0_PRIPA|nr:hypothetical protein PRIPAC_84312 [Pristionchus pacificus]|eukprot:PDM69433.1 hypothetical protein PRIPAC_44529 [Pristionchus pacificus]